MSLLSWVGVGYTVCGSMSMIVSLLSWGRVHSLWKYVYDCVTSLKDGGTQFVEAYL